METDPWKHIDDFVHRNFMQDILNQFNERMTLEPDRVPAELEAKKSRKSSRKQTNQPSQENPVKQAKRKNDSVTDNERSMRSEEATLSQGVSFESEEKRVSDMETTRKKRKSNTKKQKRVWDKTSSRNQRALGNGSKSSVKPSVTAKRSRKEKKNNEREIANTNETENENENENKNESNDENKNSVADTSEAENGITMKSGATHYQSMMDISTNTNCGLLFATSTPDVSVAMESNKSTLAKNVSSGSKGCATKNSSNDFEKSPSNQPEIDKRIAKFERDTNLKLKRSDEESKKELVHEKKPVVPYCEQNGKTKTTEKRKVGKFERLLLEKKKARRDRKIQRETRKAERAMEKFSHHVTTIAQKMGYLPNHTSSHSDSGDSSDYSDESSYTGSSSSYSECSCSCSCSCGSSESSYSESDGYSEYTVCSCSGHSDSSSSDSSSSDSSSSDTSE
ncbi:myb-like protein X isoform X2 [Hylaeus volcanicus]|uniref:myb-like protein X isoform X2 n=1 Tax=Hylaeus volcanicus TaxID=313075 RepID=UPI0023B809B8|nr:myb-like protein X isoform X2 [Hylaeus volcanicus]